MFPAYEPEFKVELTPTELLSDDGAYYYVNTVFPPKFDVTKPPESARLPNKVVAELVERILQELRDRGWTAVQLGQLHGWAPTHEIKGAGTLFAGYADNVLVMNVFLPVGVYLPPPRR